MEFQKNPDGTDKLDEQGNPIPVTITDDKDKEFAKVNKQLVEEIKEMRNRLSVAEGLLKEKNEVPPDTNKQLTDEEKLELLLEKKLKEKEALSAKANKQAAFEKYIAEHAEFNPENDPTGLKKEALLKKINQFNTDGLKTIEEFTSVIGDAKILLLGTDKTTDTSRDINPYSNPPKTNNIPPGNKSNDLSSKELKLMQQSGVSKEKILKLKATNPEYLETLLEFVRD